VATFELRTAEASDVEALQALFRRSSLSNEGDRATLLAHPDALVFADIAVKEGRTRVATEGGDIVGFVTLALAAAAELDDLFVEPSRMGQGIGRLLVDDAVATARANGYRRLEVIANPHAIAFYSKVGFAFDRDAETRFGPAPRLCLDMGDDL
jgi:GNAT superfamily N-acetyltransferase